MGGTGKDARPVEEAPSAAATRLAEANGLGAHLVTLSLGGAESAAPAALWAHARRRVPHRNRLYVFEGGLLCGPPEGEQSAYPWWDLRAVRRSKTLVATGLESGTWRRLSGDV